MSNLIKRFSVLLFCLSGILPASAFALGGTDAYVGVSVGQATLVRQSDPDETATGYKLFGGLHATGPFYVEVSHVNLGTYFKDTPSEFEVSGNALHLSGKLPFTPSIYALAKVGIFSWDVEYNSSNVSRTGTDTSYGFSVGWAMPTGYTVRLDWEHYADIGKYNAFTGNDMTLLSLGISMHF
ncbi:MAG: outer membrane beta-barrel protein [Gammaproteobacteria bacterium]|nr:outer membrane beta-barrel protein [Gammaproteobacteria bacterium]